MFAAFSLFLQSNNEVAAPDDDDEEDDDDDNDVIVISHDDDYDEGRLTLFILTLQVFSRCMFLCICTYIQLPRHS